MLLSQHDVDVVNKTFHNQALISLIFEYYDAFARSCTYVLKRMSGIIEPDHHNAIQEFNDDVEPTAQNTNGPYKVLLLGDATVGKTSLIKRLITGKFLEKNDSNYVATIGIDYKRKVSSNCSSNLIILKSLLFLQTIRIEENKFVKLQIWDTAGQERFRGLAKNYYRGADAVVLVYDVTQARTFVDVPSWLEELESFSLDERNILQVIVANKVRPLKLFFGYFFA